MKLSRPFLSLFIFSGFLYWAVSQDYFLFSKVMGWRDGLKTKNVQQINYDTYLVYDFLHNKTGRSLTLEFTAGKHFWYPQMAIWLENTAGQLIETLFVTEATAKGQFSAGRTKENFKQFDRTATTVGKLARVDALPYWSHKRGILESDGFYSPSPSSPLPDAITGATPSGNFILNASTENEQDKFKILFEVNVAFDDNEYFSEYDFPDDTIYHSSTGQLGQPSLIFEALVNTNQSNKYFLLNPIGHGHHSAQNGILYQDLSKLTTALGIVERVLVKIE